MKSALIALVIFAASFAHAEKRSFRINPDSAVDGYAVAWGVEKAKTDFEKFDQLGDEAPARLLKKKGKRVKNFIVQLETNTILETIGGEKVDGRVGGAYLEESDYNIAIAPVPAKGLDYRQRLLLVLSNEKNNRVVSKMLVIMEGDGQATQVNARDVRFNALFENAVANRLSASHLARLQTSPFRDLAIHATPANPYETADFEVKLSDPSTESVLTISGTMQITMKAGLPQIQILKIRAN